MILDKFPVIRPLTTPEDFAKLTDVAAKDNHGVYYPSHIVEKAGEIIGYLSVCKIPLVELWAHTEKAKPLDSMIMVNAGENLVRMLGQEHVFTTIGSNSNFRPVVERHLGYSKIYDTTVFVKKL